jgi:hypothetical protein
LVKISGSDYFPNYLNILPAEKSVELVHGFMNRVHRAQCTCLLPRDRSTQDGGMRFYEIERLFSKLISVVGEWIKGHDLVRPHWWQRERSPRWHHGAPMVSPAGLYSAYIAWTDEVLIEKRKRLLPANLPDGSRRLKRLRES